MPFLGVKPSQEFSSVEKQTITGDGSTSYTLTQAVSTENDLSVFVNNVRQEPGVAYTAAGTTITFTEAVNSDDSCYVIYIARVFSSADSPGIDDKATSKVLTIDGDGNIGIGDATPSYKLDITGDLNYTGTLRQNGTAVEFGVSTGKAIAMSIVFGG